MKKVFLILALLASLNANAQKIHRNQWSVQPKIGVSSFGLWGILNVVEEQLLVKIPAIDQMSIDRYSEFWTHNSWYIPEIDCLSPIYSIDSNDGAKLSKPYWWREALWGDYSHTFKFSAGYELSWKSLVSPWGAFLGVDWEYSQIALKDCAETGNHRSQAIVPSVGLRFRLWGGRFDKNIKPALEVGTSYVYNFKYHGPNDYDLDVLNNGFRGKVALGVETPLSHTAILIEYEHEFFKHFNQYYECNGVKPFESYKNSFGEISLRISQSF